MPRRARAVDDLAECQARVAALEAELAALRDPPANAGSVASPPGIAGIGLRDDVAIQRILRSIDRETVVLAFAHAPDSLKERVLANMSATAAAPLRQELKRAGLAILTDDEPRGRQIANAQWKVLEAALEELQERLDEQTATADVLRAIARPEIDLEAVLQTLIDNATRLSGADHGAILTVDGPECRPRAWSGIAAEEREFWRGRITRVPEGQRGLLGSTINGRRIVHVPDARVHPSVTPGPFGYLTRLGVPLFRGDDVIGLFTLERKEARPYSQSEIDLVTRFADQAEIALENARLFQGLRDRNTALAEALVRETATAEVLKVIARAPTDLQGVLDTLVASAADLVDAGTVTIQRRDGDVLRNVALYGSPSRGATDVIGATFPATTGAASGRALLNRETIHVTDMAEAVLTEFPDSRAGQERFGYRSEIVAPLMRRDEAIGVMAVCRYEVRPFDAREIAMVESFADQAVIALENARLFHELNERNAQLTEALEQRTAMAEVLQIISRSPTELQTALDTIADSTSRLLDAGAVAVFLREGDFVRAVAGEAFKRRTLVAPSEATPLDRRTLVGRAMLDRTVIHVPDMSTTSESELIAPTPGLKRVRSDLIVPLLLRDSALGAIAVTRSPVRPFSEREIALVETFADQAGIALENARLFQELKQRLNEQTASSEVLRLISESPTDLQPVLDTIVEQAVRILGTDIVRLRLIQNGQSQLVVQSGGSYNAALAYHAGKGVVDERAKTTDSRVDSGDDLDPRRTDGRAMLERRTVRVSDLQAADAEWVGRARDIGLRSFVSVPLVRGDKALGVINAGRFDTETFTDRQVALLETFADQAVIAIENARLFQELQQRNRELTAALEQQTATADVLQTLSRAPTDLQAALDHIVKSAARLCDADGVRIRLREADQIRIVAHVGAVAAGVGMTHPFSTEGPSGWAVRVMLDRRTLHVPDVPAQAPDSKAARSGVGSLVIVPLLRAGEAIGALNVGRDQVRPFTDRQIALLETFADQAVIAIENARLFRELADRSEQLERASRHKSEFLANMSHELRTPLNAIIGYTELTLDGIYGEVSDRVLEVLGRVRTSGQHLLGLINAVLDLSRIEAGQLVLAPAPYSPRDLVHTVVAQVESLAAAKGLRLRVTLPSDLPNGVGDERRLTQVLLNLVGNAIKFTDVGEVAIRVVAMDGHFTFAVTDTGPGVAEADRERIFGEFQQADDRRVRERGGTGLGLAIARRIVELHGGRIWLESEVGRGSTFTFTVPLLPELPT